MLTYSRGALLAIAIGLALWFAFVPLRLRGAVALGGVVLAVFLPSVVWASAQDGLTRDGAELALRIDAGQAFGALLLLMVVAMTVAGLAVGFLSVRAPARASAPAPAASRTLVGALLTVPVVAIIMLANAPGGIRRPGVEGLEAGDRPGRVRRRRTRRSGSPRPPRPAPATGVRR